MQEETNMSQLLATTSLHVIKITLVETSVLDNIVVMQIHAVP